MQLIDFLIIFNNKLINKTFKKSLKIYKNSLKSLD